MGEKALELCKQLQTACANWFKRIREGFDVCGQDCTLL